MDQEKVYARRQKFRALAGQYAAHAKKLLASPGQRALIYATIEVRFALEALTYDLACNYLDELGMSSLDWQPPKLLEQLVEIDPHAEQTVYIKMGPDAEGKRVEYQDNRLDLKKLKKRYYKISNALHAPMLSSLESGKVLDGEKLRKSCTEALAAIEKVLASTIMVIVPGHHPIFEFSCECGHLVRRRSDPLWVHQEDPKRGAP